MKEKNLLECPFQVNINTNYLKKKNWLEGEKKTSIIIGLELCESWGLEKGVQIGDC